MVCTDHGQHKFNFLIKSFNTTVNKLSKPKLTVYIQYPSCSHQQPFISLTYLPALFAQCITYSKLKYLQTASTLPHVEGLVEDVDLQLYSIGLLKE